MNTTVKLPTDHPLVMALTDITKAILAEGESILRERSKDAEIAAYLAQISEMRKEKKYPARDDTV